ncbi:MAG: hypothetical protein ACTSVM_04175 [Candidatus Ranarchaeia archaeon]
MVDLKLSDSSIIRIQKKEFPEGSGKVYLDIRKFYWDDSSKAPGWRPTRKGIFIPWDNARKVLELAMDIIEKSENE